MKKETKDKIREYGRKIKWIRIISDWFVNLPSIRKINEKS